MSSSTWTSPSPSPRTFARGPTLRRSGRGWRSSARSFRSRSGPRSRDATPSWLRSPTASRWTSPPGGGAPCPLPRAPTQSTANPSWTAVSAVPLDHQRRRPGPARQQQAPGLVHRNVLDIDKQPTLGADRLCSQGCVCSPSMYARVGVDGLRGDAQYKYNDFEGGGHILASQKAVRGIGGV